MEDFARRKRGRCLRLRRRSGRVHNVLAGYAPLAARTAAIRGILLCGTQQQPYYRFQTSPHAPSDQTGFLILIETRVVIPTARQRRSGTSAASAQWVSALRDAAHRLARMTLVG